MLALLSRILPFVLLLRVRPHGDPLRPHRLLALISLCDEILAEADEQTLKALQFRSQNAHETERDATPLNSKELELGTRKCVGKNYSRRPGRRSISIQSDPRQKQHHSGNFELFFTSPITHSASQYHPLGTGAL